VVTDGAITLSKALIFEGDVNMASGSIVFDGPVEISGSVEQGARVEVTGDLTIGGLITGGVVIARGNITVAGGITSDGASKVVAGGDLRADFLEHAQVECRGSLTVAKSIVASKVGAGGDITVTAADGLVVGGFLACANSLVCGQLGRSAGAKTQVTVGVSPRLMRAVLLRQGRLARLSGQLAQDRDSLNEVSGRNQAQMTKRHAESKAALRVRVARLRKIIANLEAVTLHMKSRMTINEDARISVTGALSPNCDLEVAGRRIPVADEVASVAVVGRITKGSHLVPLDQPEAGPGAA
jgi:uncharacterized protein (DUF342 family)